MYRYIGTPAHYKLTVRTPAHYKLTVRERVECQGGEHTSVYEYSTPLAFSRPRCVLNSHWGGHYRETIIGRGIPDVDFPDDGFPISPLPDTRSALGIGHRGTPISGIGYWGGAISGRVSSGGVSIGKGNIGAD